MAALGSLVVKLALEYAEYTKGLSKSDQDALKFAQNAQRHFDNAGSASKEFFVGVVKGAATAGAAFLGVSAIIGSLKSSIDTLATLDDMAQKTGSSVENLSRLQKVASAFNQGFEEVDSSLNKLAKGMATVDDETNKTNKALAALGISSKDAAGNLRDPSEVMVDVAKRLQNYQDGASKAALVTDLFGKSGANLLPYLNDLAENVHRFAGSSTEAAQKASELQDKLGVMRVRVQELWTGVASNLVPAFTDTIDVFNRARVESENTAKSGDLKSWAEGLTTTFVALANTIDNAVTGVQLVGAATAKIAASRAIDNEFNSEKDKIAPSNALGFRWVKAGSEQAKKLDEIEARRVAAQKAIEDAYEQHHAAILSGVDRFNRNYAKLRQDQAEKEAAENDPEIKRLLARAAAAKQPLNYTTGNAKATADKISDYEKIVRSINEKIAAEKLEGEQEAALTEGQKLASKVKVEMRDGTLKLSEAEKIRVTGLLEELLAEEKNTDAKKAAEKATLDAAQARVKYIETLSKSLDKTQEEVAKQQEYNDRIGLSKIAIADLDAAKLEDQATMLDGLAIKELDKNLDSEQYELLKARAEELRKLAKLKRDGAAKEESYDAAQKAAEEWKKTADQINQALTDSLMRGFESGKGFAENFRDAVVNMFKTMVLRPVISAILQPVAAGMANGLSGSGFSGMNALSSGSSLWNAWQGSTAGAAGGMVAGIGNLVGSSSMSAFGTGMGLSSAQAAAASEAYAAAGMTSEAGAISAGSSVGAAMPFLAAAMAIYSIAKSLDHSGTYHTGALAEYSAASGLLTGSNGSHAGPRAGDTNYGTGFGGVDFSQQTADFVSGVSKSIVGILDSTASTFGKTAGYTAATAFADDTSKDGAWGALLIQKMGQSVVNWNDTRNSSWAPREFGDGEAGRTQYLAELSKSVRTALDDIGLPGWAQSMLDNLGNAPALTDLAAVVDKINATQKALVSMGDVFVGFSNLTDAAISALVTASGGVDRFVAGMSGFYDGYFSEAEKIANVSNQVADSLSAVGLQMPATREEFRALVEQELALGESGAGAVAALLGVSGAFGTVADYSKRMADEAIATAQRQADETARIQQESLAAAQQIAGKRADLELRIMELSGDAAGALAVQRQRELASMDETLRPLQQRIYALEDIATAEQNALTTFQNFTSGINDALNTARSDLQASWDDLKRRAGAADTARQALDAAYKAQADTFKQTISQFDTFTKSLADFRNQLAGGDLSTLSPEQKYLRSKAEFERVQGLARTGDADAIGQLQGAANAFLTASRGYNASSGAYASDFASADAALQAVQAFTQSKADDGRAQLEALNAQVSGLLTVNASVLSVEDAIANLQAVLPDAEAAQQELNLRQQEVNALLGLNTGVMSLQAAIDAFRTAQSAVTQANTNQSAISSMYRDILGRDAEASGMANWMNVLNNGGTLDQVRAGIQNSPENIIQDLYTSILGRAGSAEEIHTWQMRNLAGTSMTDIRNAFLNSDEYLHGSHANGLDYVPFDGYRAELHRGERVQTATQVKESDTNNREMVVLLREIMSHIKSGNGISQGQNERLDRVAQRLSAIENQNRLEGAR